jgi:hypothetical protein
MEARAQGTSMRIFGFRDIAGREEDQWGAQELKAKFGDRAFEEARRRASLA